MNCGAHMLVLNVSSSCAWDEQTGDKQKQSSIVLQLVKTLLREPLRILWQIKTCSHKLRHYAVHNISEPNYNGRHELLWHKFKWFFCLFDDKKVICRLQLRSSSQGSNHRGKPLRKTTGASRHHFVNWETGTHRWSQSTWSTVFTVLKCRNN